MAAQFGPVSADPAPGWRWPPNSSKFGPDSAKPATGWSWPPNRAKFTAEPFRWSTKMRGEAEAEAATKVVITMRYMAGFCTVL